MTVAEAGRGGGERGRRRAENRGGGEREKGGGGRSSAGTLRRARLVHGNRIMSRNSLCCAAGVGLLAAFLLGGCASGQMNRIDANRDIYETWPIETRQAVLDGKVEPGMLPEMVKVAWGTPTEVVASPGGGPGDEIWVYKKGGVDDSAMMGYPGASYPGGGYPGSGYPGSGYPGAGYPGSGYPSTVGGPSIGISTGRGGTGIITGGGTGISIGGGAGGIGIGGGGMGGPIMARPTPAEVKEVVFRNGVVHRADLPTDPK